MIVKWLASALAVCAVVASFFFGLWQQSKAARATDHAKAEKKKSEVQSKANQAMIDGLNEETEVRNEKVDTDNRDHFTKQ